MANNIIGRPVRGDDFFDRETERKKIWQMIEAKNNLLVLAPRRVGKTSLLYKLRSEAPKHRCYSVYESVGDAKSELAFTEKVYKAVAQLPEAAPLADRLKKGPFRRFFEKIKSFEIAELLSLDFRELPQQEWESFGRELIHGINSLDGRWLIMIDEVPVFVSALLREDPTGARARVFLNWFRDVRQGEPDRDPVSWIVAGSIGLDKVARRLQMVDTINDFRVFELGPFSPNTANQFLQELSKSNNLPLSTEVSQRICERAGWLIPHHLQILFAGLKERCDDGNLPPSVTLVDVAFEDVLGHAYRLYFDHWSLRLVEELGTPQDDWAMALLTVAARDPAGASQSVLNQTLARRIKSPEKREKELKWLLEVLVGDGYLVEQQERFLFRSPLLREYWLRRFVK